MQTLANPTTISRPALPPWKRRLLVSLASIIVFTLGASGGGLLARRLDASAPIEKVAPQSVPASSPASPMPPVVAPDWLNHQLHNPGQPLILIDLSDAEVYDREHIPGAIHAWWQDGMDRNAATYGQALSPNPNPTGPREWFRSLGIDTSRTVVVYDNHHGRDASRFIWLMAFSGLNQSAVLNGGLAAWKGAGLPVSDESTLPVANQDLANDIILHMVIGTDELATRISDPALHVVDIRTPGERTDRLNDTIREGSIPSSVSIPWTSTVLDEAGQLKSSSDLRSLFLQAGIDPGDDIVIYGRFGSETGQFWLALKVAGYDKVRIYDAGWADWASRNDLPIDPP